MRAGWRLVLAASSMLPVGGWAPFDALAGLFGAPPLHDPAGVKSDAATPLHDVEHVECHRTASGCQPHRGCQMTMRGCEPLLGHYWTTAEPVPDSAGSLFPGFLTPSPPTRIMTKRGLMDVTPGFFYASYKLVVRASCLYCYSEKSLTARSFLAISAGR